MLLENREIFIPHLYLAPPQGVTCRNFVKVFDLDKSRMNGLPYGEQEVKVIDKKRLTGAHSPVRGHPRGSKVVPLNSWGRVSY